jgi:hypothetical protein
MMSSRSLAIGETPPDTATSEHPVERVRRAMIGDCGGRVLELMPVKIQLRSEGAIARPRKRLATLAVMAGSHPSPPPTLAFASMIPGRSPSARRSRQNSARKHFSN